MTPQPPVQPGAPVLVEPPWYLADLRRLAGAATAGLVAGALVNGVGGRLAMLLLARLNPGAAGLVSDDGFVIGRFGLGTTLLFVAQMAALGVLGGVLALALRSLRFGPAWFRVASWAGGPAVVVGAMLVHADGVDFRVLGPLWLTVGLFLVLPGLYALVVVGLLDRWVAPGGWPWAPGRRWTLGLLSAVASGPFLVLLVPGLVIRGAYHQLPWLRGEPVLRTVRLGARTVLVLVFVASVLRLADTVAALR